MPKKSKTGRGKSAASGSEEKERTQRERFIETARAIGVDETGKEFDRALKKLVPVKRKRS